MSLPVSSPCRLNAHVRPMIISCVALLVACGSLTMSAWSQRSSVSVDKTMHHRFEAVAFDYKEDIAFAAFGGWDAAGAKSFGYPTVWVNRFNQPPEQLGIPPDRTVSNLQGLLEYVLNTPPGQPRRH